MDIRTQALKEHSKENAEIIVSWVGNSPERMQQLVDIFLHDEYRVVQRLSQVISKISDVYPDMMLPHLDSFVQRMQDETLPVAVKRNVIRLLQNVDIPEHLHGIVMNTCFDLLADPNETVAVRVFSMTVLDNLSKSYPEIRQELIVILNEQLELGCTAGFRARAKKIINKKSG